nr:P3 protein [Grapevine polerovirus 1]UYT09257.1 P3 protein [Grapevine polerovirus 1]
MNSSNNQGRGRNARRRRNRRRRRAGNTAQQRVLVVPAAPRRTRRSRGRRGAGRLSRARRGSGGQGNVETFSFIIDSIKANDSGVVKFGPSLSQCPALSQGMLKAYHQYKITSLSVSYISESASTAEGAITLEIDTSRALTTVASGLIRFGIAEKGSPTRVFSAAVLGGVNFLQSDTNQFHLLYKGTGTSSSLAGTLRCSFNVSVIAPK